MRSQIRRARYLRQVKKHPPIFRPDTLRRAATWIIYARVGGAKVLAAQLGGEGRNDMIPVGPVNRASIFLLQLFDNRAKGVTITERVPSAHRLGIVMIVSTESHRP